MDVAIMGDSISTFHGYCPEGYAVFYTPENAGRAGLRDIHDIWWDRVARALGATHVTNDSYSGSLVSGTAFPSGCQPERIEALLRDGKAPDIILVYMGMNDFVFSAVPGNPSHRPLKEERFYGAYRIMLERMRGIAPNARIVCGTVMRGYLDGSPQKKLDLVNDGGTSLWEYDMLISAAASDEGVEVARLFDESITYPAIDYVHPTRRGQAILAQRWMEELGL